MEWSKLKQFICVWTLRKSSILISLVYIIVTLGLAAYFTLHSIHPSPYQMILLYLLDVSTWSQFLFSILLLVAILMKIRILILLWIIVILTTDLIIIVITVHYFSELDIENMHPYQQIFVQNAFSICCDCLAGKLSLGFVIVKYYRATGREGPDSISMAPFSALKENDL